MSRLLRLLISLALIVYVLYAAGLFTRRGWSELLATCADADSVLLICAILYAFLIDYVSSIKWYFLARARHLKASLNQLFRMYLVGRFFNLVLPTSIGGDVVRITLLSRLTGRTADSAAVVFVERFTGFVVLVVLTLVALLAVFEQHSDLPWLLPAAVAALVGLLGGVFLLLDARFIRAIEGVSAKLGKPAVKVFSKVVRFRSALLEFGNAPLSLFWAVVNSLIFYAFAIVNVWISALVFTDQVDFIDMVSAVPLIMFIMNLPFSIGGIGLMEFAYTLILGMYGLSPATAISTALLMRLKTLIVGGAGGVIFSVLRSDQKVTPQQVRQMSESVDKKGET